MNYSIFFKREFSNSIVVLIPFFLGFNSIALLFGLLFVFIHFAVIQKSAYVFYLLIFFYKYAGNQFISVDKSILNVISLSMSFYYLYLYVSEGKYKNSNQFPLIILLVYLGLNSTFNSIMPAISINKTINFAVHSFALIYILENNLKRITELLLNLATILVFSSMFLPKSMVNYTGLNLHCGILNQSQAYGFIMAMILPIQLINIKVTQYKKYYLFILISSASFIFLSGMRSAFLVIFVFSIVMFFNKEFVNWKKYIYLIFLVFSFYILLINNSFLENLFDKRGVELQTSMTSFDEMFESRNKLAAPSLENFENNPIFGIGFGLPTEATIPFFDFNDRWGVKYLPGTNILISYPVEKGVLYSSILEELGVFGAFIFIYYLSMFIKIERWNSFSILLVLSVLIISLGEASLFSPNGIGIFALLNMQIARLYNTAIVQT